VNQPCTSHTSSAEDTAVKAGFGSRASLLIGSIAMAAVAPIASAATATAAREQRAGWRARVGLLQRRSTVARGGEGASTRAWPRASVRARPRTSAIVKAGIALADTEGGTARIAPGATPIRGVVGRFGVAAARGVSLPGRRRVHCHMARRNRIPDDVGFDYDEFEDFVSTPTSQEEKEQKARRRKKAEEEDGEDYVHISHIPAPPDPREDVPAVFSYFSPLYGNKAEEAKALAIQRAYARQLWEEYGELPDRSKMWAWKREPREDDEEARVIAGDYDRTEAREWKEEPKFVRDADGNKVKRPVTDGEYNYEVSRLFNTWREKEHTYPQLRLAPRMDPYRLREKFGMRPTVEGKMIYPDFIELMHQGRVGRLLHYDQGRTVIVEVCEPGKELGGPEKKQRFEVKIPGDAIWEVNKLAQFNKRSKIYSRVHKERAFMDRTGCSQFVHLDRIPEPLINMFPYAWPIPILYIIGGYFNAGQNTPKRKIQRFKPFGPLVWLDKKVFNGQLLPKKEAKVDMMEEFGKSKAKMIGGKVGDKDKEGSFSGLTFDDVAGVDHIVEEFKFIIEVMKEFKEFQETKQESERRKKNEKYKEMWNKTLPNPADPETWKRAKENFIEEFSGWPMKDLAEMKAELKKKADQKAKMTKMLKEIARMPPDERKKAAEKLRKRIPRAGSNLATMDPDMLIPETEEEWAEWEEMKQKVMAFVDKTDSQEDKVDRAISRMAPELSAERAKLSIPKGVLFEGPPGTGKTLLAKAIAGEAGVPFFYANGSEFVEMFVGVAAKRVRDLFKRARQVSPSIIFIDELDTIGRSRALYGNMDSATQEREAGLLQLLVELDGFDTKANAGVDQEMVLVMGATNLSAQLDPALLRSGRFERSFHIGVPKRHKDRLAILQVHAKKLNIPREGDHKWESDALLNRTAELTDGYSGASLAALLNEASILSVRADRKFVNLSDVERVLERNLVGVSSAPLEDGWGKDHMAMVEAGRAVLWSSKRSMNYCPEILRVTIKPAGEQATGIMLKPERSDENSTTHFNGEERPDTFDDFIDGLAMLIAGRCVETVFYGPQGISVQTKGDLVSAADIAYEIVTGSGLYPHQGAGLSPMWPEELIEHFRIPRTEMDVGVYDMMVRAHIRAEEYINYYKPVILQVASELLAHGSLYGSYIRELVEEHEIAMKLAKDEELARADERAAEEEERARKDALHEQELEARRQADAAADAAAAAAAQAAAAKEVEEEGKGSAIDVESSDEPLSSDPFGTAAAAVDGDDAAEYKDQLSRALRFVSLSGDEYRRSEYPEDFPPEDETADEETAGAADVDADAGAGRLARALRDVRLSGAAFMTAAEVEEVVERVAPAAEEILFVDDGEYREMLRRALRDVRLSGGSTMTAAEVSEVMRKIDPDTVAYREQYKAELINMMKQKEAEKKAEDEIKKGDDDEGDDRVSRALRT